MDRFTETPPAVVKANTAATAAQIAPPSDAVTPVRTLYDADRDQALYDADRDQHIPFQFEHKGRMHTVTFHMGPQTDEALIAYDRLMDTRLRRVKDEAGQGVSPETNAAAAAEWLFDDRALGVDGIGRRGTPLPQNWKSMAPITPGLKEGVILSAYLAVEVKDLPAATPDEFIDWGDSSETSAVVLRALYNGDQLLLTHVFNPASEGQRREYRNLKSRAMVVQGSRVGQPETRLPATWKALGALYDQILCRAEGYAGRIPLHHKVAALDEFMSQTQQALAKN